MIRSLITRAFDKNSPKIIDVTDTEAFVVRKDGDGGDIFTVNTTDGQVKLLSAGVFGNAAAPTLAFGDGDSGFYESEDDLIRLSISGTNAWFWNDTAFGASGFNGPRLLRVSATAINPNIVPIAVDSDTGIGSSGADALSLIAGGKEGIRIAEAGNIAALYIPEITTPTAIVNFGSIYPKVDNNLYFQDGAGVEHQIGGAIGRTKGYNHTSRGTGTHYVGGFYDAPAADANLTNASTTQTDGSVNGAYGAHTFIVAALAGVTDGSDLVLTVTGTSITEAGVRNAADSEIIVADCTAASTNEYFETAKKWIGQVTLTLSSTSGTTFNFDFNYGLAKYEDFLDSDVVITAFEIEGEAGANDSGYNVSLLHHSSTGWTYHASAFSPGGTVICDMNTDYNTEVNLVSGEDFAYKRTNLNTAIVGSSTEGVIVKITTGSANSVDHSDIHITYI